MSIRGPIEMRREKGSGARRGPGSETASDYEMRERADGVDGRMKGQRKMGGWMDRRLIARTLKRATIGEQQRLHAGGERGMGMQS